MYVCIYLYIYVGVCTCICMFIYTVYLCRHKVLGIEFILNDVKTAQDKLKNWLKSNILEQIYLSSC
jgi:hypothetical protein